MTKKLLSGVLCLSLITCIVMSGCAQKTSSYNWEVSIVETFNSSQGGLSVLPWLITMEDAKEILHIDDLPSDAYQQTEDPYLLVVKNVKLKEFRIPVDMQLMFAEDPNITQEEGLRLIECMFYVPEVDGYSLFGSDSPPFETIPEETREAFLQTQKEDREACIKALLQRDDIVGTKVEQMLTNSLLNGPILMGIRPELSSLKEEVQAYTLFSNFGIRFYIGIPF